jgi:RNA-directed DNA polymerase
VKHNIDLYSRIYDWENLERAYHKARIGKRGRSPAADFERKLEDNLVALQEELKTQTYIPGKYHSFYIHEPKRRLISAAPFRDRVVHHALCSIIEPLFERRFIADSYANRVDKGTHRALDRCSYFSRRYRFALQMDVVQFFPSIDHEILRTALSSVIQDDRVMWLCDLILSSGEGVQAGEYSMVYFPGDDLFAACRPRGLPIGNLTSQFWANVFMNAFDHFVKRELHCSAYLRYVDDMVLFADCKNILWRWLDASIQYLDKLRLTIHANRAFPSPVKEGLPFLGFTLFPTHRRLKAKKAISFRQKFRHLSAELNAGQLDLSQLHASVRGWINHVRYGDTWGLRRAILSSPRRRK